MTMTCPARSSAQVPALHMPLWHTTPHSPQFIGSALRSSEQTPGSPVSAAVLLASSTASSMGEVEPASSQPVVAKVTAARARAVPRAPVRRDVAGWFIPNQSAGPGQALEVVVGDLARHDAAVAVG